MSTPLRKTAAPAWIVGPLVVILAGWLGLSAPASAGQVEKAPTNLDLVPRDAFAFVHLRLDLLQKTDWFQLVPPEIQQEIMTAGLSAADVRGPVQELTVVLLRPQDIGMLFFGGGGRAVKKMETKTSETTTPEAKQIETKTIEIKPSPDEKKPRNENPKDLKNGAAEPVSFQDDEEDAGPILIVKLAEMWRPGETAKKVGEVPGGGTIYAMRFPDYMLVLADGKHCVIGRNKSTLERVGKGRKGPLQEALAAAEADDALLTVGVAMTDAVREKLTGGRRDGYTWSYSRRAAESKLFFRLAEIETAVLTVRAEGSLAAKASATFTSAETARLGQWGCEDMLAILRLYVLGEWEYRLRAAADRTMDPAQERDLILAQTLLGDAEQLLHDVKLTRVKDGVTAEVGLERTAAQIAAHVKAVAQKRLGDPQVLERRRRLFSEINLKQIGLAMHGFHDAYKGFPPQAICDVKTGKPLLSWRVAVLPYIESWPLYKQFNLDEPWDSAHNMKLLTLMPKTYAVPGQDPAKGETHYQVFTGKGALFELKPGPGRWGAQGMRMMTVTDGTSNTLMVVEAAKTVPWTKPEDLEFDLTGTTPLPALGGIYKDGFHAAFADGSVRFLRTPLRPELLRALIGRADNMIVDIPE